MCSDTNSKLKSIIYPNAHERHNTDFNTLLSGLSWTLVLLWVLFLNAQMSKWAHIQPVYFLFFFINIHKYTFFVSTVSLHTLPQTLSFSEFGVLHRGTPRFVILHKESIYSTFFQTMYCISVYSFGNNNIDNCLRDGGLERGRGTHFEHVPTNELYCAPGNVYDSLKLRCVCVCARVCVPTYWQLRDLNSLFFLILYATLLSPFLSVSCFLSFHPASSPSLFFHPSPPSFSHSDVGFALLWPQTLSVPLFGV